GHNNLDFCYKTVIITKKGLTTLSEKAQGSIPFLFAEGFPANKGG
ncbi:unnamed protein product, partial [marine sediment metagenome]